MGAGSSVETAEANGGLRAWSMHQQVLQLKREIEIRALEMGRILNEIHDGGHYLSLGCDTWHEYLAQPEVDIRPRTAYRWMSFAQCATVAQIDQADAAEVGAVKAEIIEPLVRVLPPAQVAELVEDAKTLAVSDLRRKVNDAIDGPIPDDREWLEELGSAIIRRAAKLSRDEAPLNLLDEIITRAMGGVERLKEKA